MLRILGLYSNSCECHKVFFRQTNCSNETTVTEHHMHNHLVYPGKSAVANTVLDPTPEYQFPLHQIHILWPYLAAH